MPTAPPTAPPDRDTLTDWGVRFINAMLDSAGPDTLGRDYWTRARTALEAGAATASFPEAVSKTAAKLQIHGSLSAESSAVIGELAGHMPDETAFGSWSELCRRDAVFVTALARIERDRRREAAKAAGKAKAPAAPAAAGEPGF